MYIRKVEIENIKVFDKFSMEFPEGKEAGWHVIIGDNGAGKSSLVRAIALGLIGPNDSKALRLDFKDWAKRGADYAQLRIEILGDQTHDDRFFHDDPLQFGISLWIGANNAGTYRVSPDNQHLNSSVLNIWSGFPGWFSAGFGPFRRFLGGNSEWIKIYSSDPRVAAHLSLFGEDVAMTEALTWLRELHIKRLENAVRESRELEHFVHFLNQSELLPHGAQIHEVTSEGVFFVDGNGNEVEVTRLSDGFRSLMSLVFELIRQLIRTYGANLVFQHCDKSQFIIDLPGVVIIDEIDAHLHPTWQTRIGQWFTKYFPKIQFIVTTHSPLICRAAAEGSIWRLAAPGSGQTSGPVSELEKKRLVYGDILDAYGTEVFGENIAASPNSDEMRNRMAELNKKSIMGEISPEESKELQELKSFLSPLQ